MFNIEIDLNSPIPKHYQIKQALLKAVRKGTLQFGDMLPPEEEIAKAFGVSRMTIRRALEDLVRVGYVKRSPGVGTIVTRPPNPRKFWTAISFTEEIRSRGFIPTSKVTFAEKVPAPPAVQKALGLSPGEAVIRVDRIRFANHEVAALNTSHIPTKLCPGLLNMNLEVDGLYHIIQDVYKLEVTSSNRTYEKGMADEEEANLLEIEVGDPVLRITGITYVGDRLPMDYCLETYRE